MKQKTKPTIAVMLGTILVFTGPIHAQRRYMERLGRGVVAVRASSSQAYVGWRMLGTDSNDIAFNLYRSTGGTAVKLNSSPLTGGTNYVDNTANLTQSNTYYVRPVIDGVEQSPSGSYTLAANAAVGPYFSIPLQSIGDYYVHLAWVGDLDGDGEYDFIVDRFPNVATDTQKLEAYKRDGTFLWRVDFGPNSLNRDNISPGSSAISVGHNDGVTVYDMNNDGRAEVIIKSSNGVVFGNGATLTYGDNTTQFISVLDGMTGAEFARTTVPNPYTVNGSLSGHFGIMYCDGVNPSIVFKAKNRRPDKAFNLIVTTWDFNNGTLSQRWSWQRGNQNAPDFHQIRIVDVDGDGKDELCDGGYVLDDNGTILYSLAGVVHGDRFHIGDLDPNRPGLEGYGIQQNNPSGLAEYYYDAATGEILWEHYTDPPADLGRGIAADVDPRYPGYEVWSFLGMYNGPTNTLISPDPNRPWPNLRIWWDGDTLSENLNETKVDKWNYSTSTTSRLLTGYKYGATDTWRDAPLFYGDIFGDWREEIVFETYDHTALEIFTTNIPSDVRLYTLAHNPEYRACMTVKGYMQSNMLDYYLGDDMSTPPRPQIKVIYGDLTGDNRVDIDDISEFSEFWLATDCNNVELDFNDDCIINFYEFSLLARDWFEEIQ